ISASVVRSGWDSRKPGCRWAFRMRFSANRYSFFRSSSWLTRPVTKARKRATLEMFGFKLYRSKPRPISAFEYFGHTGLAAPSQLLGPSESLSTHSDSRSRSRRLFGRLEPGSTAGGAIRARLLLRPRRRGLERSRPASPHYAPAGLGTARPA